MRKQVYLVFFHECYVGQSPYIVAVFTSKRKAWEQMRQIIERHIPRNYGSAVDINVDNDGPAGRMVTARYEDGLCFKTRAFRCYIETREIMTEILDL